MRANTNNIKTFNLTDFLKQDEVFHYSKVTLFDADDIGYHKHNYYEIFWIEDTTLTQFLIDKKLEYAASQLIMTNISIKKIASYCGGSQSA